MSCAPKQLRLAVLAAMLQRCASVNVSRHATTHAGCNETSFNCGAFLVTFCMTGMLVVGGVTARNNHSNKKRRRMFACFGNWWKRRHQGYIRQDDTQEESVMTEVYSYHPPGFQRSMEEESLASESQCYDQNSPMLPPPRPDEESVVSEAATYFPPPNAMPLPSRSPRSSRYWNDASSFQSSLESVDSLVESCWDPDDVSLVTSMPIELADSAVIKEHIQFLQRQARTTERDERAVRQQTARTSDRKGYK
jgi:hypothetical protein